MKRYSSTDHTRDHEAEGIAPGGAQGNATPPAIFFKQTEKIIKPHQCVVTQHQ